MAKSATSARVLPDLLAQAKASQQAALSPATKASPMGGPKYKAGAFHTYIGKSGKNAGKPVTVWRYEHVANPAWSRQFDLTDLELIFGDVKTAEAAIAAFKALKS